MPVTDLTGDEGMPDWLQSLLGGVVPGGGVMQYPRSMTGSNMGYPAMTAPAGLGASPAGVPAARSLAAPQAPYGLSLGGVADAFRGAYGNIHDAIAAHLAQGSGLGANDSSAAAMTTGGLGPSALSPAAAATIAQGGLSWPAGAAQAAPSPRSAPIDPYGPTPAAGPLPVSGATIDPYGLTKPAGPLPAQPARTRSSPASAATAPPASPVRTAGAPNLGYYNPRFSTLQYDPSGVRQHPLITALNLFGGRA